MMKFRVLAPNEGDSQLGNVCGMFDCHFDFQSI